MNENQKVWSIRAAIAGTGVLILAALAPILWAVASAGIALGAITVVALVLWHGLPLLGQKLENAVLKARKAEARENPIEQHQNSLRRNLAQIKAYREATVTIDTQIHGIQDMMEAQRKKDPTYDLTRSERGLAKMQAAVAGRRKTIATAEKNAESFKLEIEREIYEWEMALAVRQTSGILSPNDANNILAEILDNEASKSVRESFNRACAELDMEVSSLNSAKSLEFDGGLTIDVSSIKIPTYAVQERS